MSTVATDLIREQEILSILYWQTNFTGSPSLFKLIDTQYARVKKLIDELYAQDPNHDLIHSLQLAESYGQADEQLGRLGRKLKAKYFKLKEEKAQPDEEYFELFDGFYKLWAQILAERGHDIQNAYLKHDPQLGDRELVMELVDRSVSACRAFRLTGTKKDVSTHIPTQEDLYSYMAKFDFVDARVLNNRNAMMTNVDVKNAGLIISGENGKILRPTTVFHEMGHALYQNEWVAEYAAAGKLCSFRSMSLHESSALLHELVQMPWRGPVSRSAPDMLRVSANKVDYVIHLAIRLKIEELYLSGEIRAKDIEGHWNKLCVEYFGKAPENCWEGWMQDMHWSLGLAGYWTSYLVGILKAIDMCRGQVMAPAEYTVSQRYKLAREVNEYIGEVYGKWDDRKENLIHSIFPDPNRTIRNFEDYVFSNFSLEE